MEAVAEVDVRPVEVVEVVDVHPVVVAAAAVDIRLVVIAK
jgi:hypothetical protein